MVDYTYEDSSTVERTTAVTHIAGTSQVQTTIEESFGELPAYAYAAGKPKFSQDISGVQTYHEYEATTLHNAVHKHTSVTKANGALVAAQSRMTEEFISADGTTSFEQESIWNGTEWLLLNSTAYEYDEQQRVVKSTHGNGRFSTTSWMCCGRLSETNEDGITTTYGYNSAHQLVETIRSEVKDGDVIVTPETITTYTRDAAGRTLTTRRDIGAMTTTESAEYDILGRVTRQTDILGRVTTTAYSADGLTTTVTTPAGATTITLRNADGSTARISGTAQRELHYSYTRNGNNLATTVTLADGSILSQSITNGNGQTIVTATPNTLGGFIYTRSEYNAKGQLTKQYQDTGSNTATTAPTLYEYDAFGNMVKQTLALSATPTKDNSPVVEMSYSVESTDEGVFSVTTNTRYNAEGKPLVSVQKLLISNLSDTIESKNLTIDERNLTSTQWVEYHVGTKRKSYNTLPTSDITAEAVSVDGFTLSQKDNAGVTTTTTRSYTANGMIHTRTDGRGNTITTVTDKAGRVLTVTDAAGNVTTTAYDSAQDSRSQVCSRLGVWLLKSHPAYGWDLTKNICELYGSNGYIRTAYTYTPYGSVTESGNTWQPIQWSSEYNDTELGLVYYNYRHYNSVDGRWINIDPIYEQGGVNLYSYARNWIISEIDNKGTSCFDCCIIDNNPWSYIAGKLFSFLSGQLYPKTWVAKVLRILNRNKEADKILSSLKNPKVSRMTTLPSSISLYFRLGARSGLRILGRVMAPINILMISIDSMIFGYCTWHCMWNDCYDGSKDNLGNKIKDKIDSFLKTFNPTE